jgi:flagellar biosynthesis/type III secretory pathway M-ring protein FliF/YscJ
MSDVQNNPKDNPFVVPFKSAFWLVVILVGLYIAALNFVSAFSSNEEGEKKQTSEMAAPAEKTEAKSEEAPKAEPKKEEAAQPEVKKEEPKKPKKKHHDEEY